MCVCVCENNINKHACHAYLTFTQTYIHQLTPPAKEFTISSEYDLRYRNKHRRDDFTFFAIDW